MLRDEAYLKDYIFNWDTQSNVFFAVREKLENFLFGSSWIYYTAVLLPHGWSDSQVP